jgi:serine/threonine protein kinase
MSSSEDIRTDASTVHRPDGATSPSSDATKPELRPVTDPGEMAEAKTVIREHDDGKQRSLGNTPASVAQVLLGRHLNHFLLEEMIGGGGMGAVFRAHDAKLDRTVAIKVIPFVGNDGDLQRRFRNEAQSAAKLDHPRIARVFGVGDSDDWHYIVFEYIHGTNIRDLVTNAGVLHVDDAVFYTCELAEAIQHAADRGIVHRDIKPSNVLIGKDNNVKLVDMGLARSDNIEMSEDMTASGVTLGTFDYISPEQARDPRDADFRSDIYSLGCTLYFMLTGRPPYPGGTMLQKLLSHGNSPPPDPRELRPEVSQDLSAVIQKMLAKDPKDRYQSAAALIADLREVARRDRLTRSQAIGSVVVAESFPLVVWLERHAPWLVAASLLVVSAGWLQLTAAASREEFSLSPSATAEPPQPVIPLVDDPETDQDVDQQPKDSTETPNELGSAPDDPPQPVDDSVIEIPAAESDQSGSPDVDNVAPPENEDTTSRTSENIEADLESLGIAVDVDQTAIDPLLFDAALDPEVIRVLGRREGKDLLADHRERYEDGVLLSKSFAESLELAAHYEVNLIEIAAPVVYSEPVEVNRSGLQIMSAISGGSVIVFETVDDTAMERVKMMEIGDHRIEMNDLHFVWNVPSGLVDGGALMRLNDNRLVRMSYCSITINNPASVDEVYAFDVVTDPDEIDWSGRDETQRDDEMLPLVALELNDVIVRGQMTMIHMDYAAELRLQWINGLVAVSDRLIDTSGARVEPPLTAPIQLSLTQVTAHIPKVFERRGIAGIEQVASRSITHQLAINHFPTVRILFGFFPAIE